MLVDSHCHIDLYDASERADIVARASAAGVGMMLNIASSRDSLARVLEIASANPSVFASVGIHPHEAEAMDDAISEGELLDIAKGNEKVVAIGETGLDYSRSPADRDRQLKSFLAHIGAARTTGLPLIVHNRDSDKDMLDILAAEMKRGPFKAVIHCFTGGMPMARAMLELGFLISASGIITFKNSGELRRVFAETPLDRILIETDSPFLAPDPHRGKRNEPAFVAEVAIKLAEVKGVPLSEIERATEGNFRGYFGL
jgi:TatD DNase family protein